MADESAGRVLAVDDRPEFVELLATDLEAQGYTVATATSGQECLDMAPEFAPEVILLDVQMPGMDGLTTCFRLKDDPRTRDVPVIFLTGHNAEEGSAVAAIAAGGADFVQKPYSPVILFSRVAAQLMSFRRLRGYRDVALRDVGSELYTRVALVDAATREIARARRAGTGTFSIGWLEPADLPPPDQGAARASAAREAGLGWREHLSAPDMVAIDGDGVLLLLLDVDVDEARERVAALSSARSAARTGVAGGPVPADGVASEIVARLLNEAAATQG